MVRGCGRPAQRWCTFLLCGNVHAVAMCLEHGEVSEVAIARLTGEPDAMPESAEERQKRRAYDRRRMALSGRG